METRPVPTPAALAALHRRRPEPGRPADAPPYDRHAWETAVQLGDLSSRARLVAFVLAHHAGADGYLPEGGMQYRSRLTSLTRLPEKPLKLALRELDTAGLLRRPHTPTGQQTHVPRPITLTVPDEAAERVPPSTGEAP